MKLRLWRRVSGKLKRRVLTKIFDSEEVIRSDGRELAGCCKHFLCRYPTFVVSLFDLNVGSDEICGI